MPTVKKYIRRAPITMIIIAINVIMMAILMWRNEHEVRAAYFSMGAMYTPSVIENGEFYRLFTSMFLHFSLEHIFGNMLLLLFLGEILERRLGKIKYLVVYLLGGIFGNVLSMLMDLRLSTDDMPISAGASGAVFALLGALAYLLIINKGKLAGVSIQRLALLIVLSIWDGITTDNIDIAAHIGGLIAGFVLTLILYKEQANDKRYVDDMTPTDRTVPIEEVGQGDKDEDNVHSGRES